MSGHENAAIERVVADLKEYPELQKRIAVLRFECEHPPRLTDEEMIEALALSHMPGDGSRPAGHISDRTMQIAVQFRDEKDWLSHDSMLEVVDELTKLEEKVQKLDFYISQLDKKQAEVIRKFYFEGMTWRELQAELHISSRTLVSRRDEGLKALAGIYQYVNRVRAKDG